MSPVLPTVPGRLRILAFAYMMHPSNGSEPGAGWALVRILAGFADVTVLTRTWPPDASLTFRGWLDAIPEGDRIRIVTVPLPRDAAWAHEAADTSWRRTDDRVDYLAWQLRATRAARRLHAAERFDLGWHLTWANAWLGTGLSMVDIPLVVGPVGGAVAPPARLLPMLGARGIAFEVARSMVRSAGRWLNPLARRAWRRSRLVLVQNRETLDWLPASTRRRATVFQNVVVDDVGLRQPRDAARPPTALFVARIVAWKGWKLAVESVAGLAGWRLIVYGDGPELPAMQALVERRGMSDRVELRGMRPRDDVIRAMREDADVLVFPSLHDEAGFAVAEAAAIGLPIVCLDVGGPPIIAGTGVPPASPGETICRLQAAMRAALGRSPQPVDLGVEARRAELLGHLRDRGILRDERSDGA